MMPRTLSDTYAFSLKYGLRYGLAIAASVLCLLCLTASLQFSKPATAPIVLPFSESFYAHALDTPDKTDSLKLAERATRASPNRAENWMLLAFARHQADRAISPRVLAALRQSYVVGPLSPDAHDWRLRYVFSNWSLMPQDLKTSAVSEADAYLIRFSGAAYLKQLPRKLPDAEGRMALGLVLLTHQRAEESARRVAEYRAQHGVGNQ